MSDSYDQSPYCSNNLYSSLTIRDTAGTKNQQLFIRENSFFLCSLQVWKIRIPPKFFSKPTPQLMKCIPTHLQQVWAVKLEAVACRQWPCREARSGGRTTLFSHPWAWCGWPAHIQDTLCSGSPALLKTHQVIHFKTNRTNSQWLWQQL